MLFRSLLFVPGNQLNMLEKAVGLKPDAFVPDMEDSVPYSEKAAARQMVSDFIPKFSKTAIPIIPRVNSLETGFMEDDMRAIVGPHIHGISIGKIGTSNDINTISQILGDMETDSGLTMVASKYCHGLKQPWELLTYILFLILQELWGRASGLKISQMIWELNVNKMTLKSCILELR